MCHLRPVTAELKLTGPRIRWLREIRDGEHRAILRPTGPHATWFPCGCSARMERWLLTDEARLLWSAKTVVDGLSTVNKPYPMQLTPRGEQVLAAVEKTP